MLLWRHRFTLVDNKRALTKVLRVVEWSDQRDRAEVTEPSPFNGSLISINLCCGVRMSIRLWS